MVSTKDKIKNKYIFIQKIFFLILFFQLKLYIYLNCLKEIKL